MKNENMPHTIKHNEKLAESLLKQSLSPVLCYGKKLSPEETEKKMREFEASCIGKLKTSPKTNANS